MKNLKSYQEKAQNFQAILTVPEFHLSSEQLAEKVSKTLSEADQNLDYLVHLDRHNLTFTNTVKALEEALYGAESVKSLTYFIWNTQPDISVREKAQAEVERIKEWEIQTSYRMDVYEIIKAFESQEIKHPQIEGEDKRLLQEYLRTFRRCGLHLPKDKRRELERLKKELSNLELTFNNNINQAKQILKFSKKDLEGIPPEYLQTWEKGEETFEIDVKLATHYIPLIRHAKKEETRKKAEYYRQIILKKENVPLLNKIIQRRAKIAHLLDYSNWAAFKTEVRMAKNPANVNKLLGDLKLQLEEKLKNELGILQELKRKDQNNPNATLHSWDIEYYYNILSREKYSVDQNELKVFFPMEKTLKGMFSTFEKVLSIKVEEVNPPYKWVEDLQLYVVSDAQTEEPLGLLYLDLYPREGKYSHFAQFSVVDGILNREKIYRRPTVALVCNFPKPQADIPTLLRHEEVETLFHEFGHALHTLLTRAHHSTFSGTSVPLDFVEVPSQLMEKWAWEPDVLNSFARDYRDSTKVFPVEILDKMKQAQKAQSARHHRFQISVGLTDMAFHEIIEKVEDEELLKISNRILEEGSGLPLQKDAAFIGRLGHLIGYDAGYYSYLWSKVIALDIASIFQNSPQGFLDSTLGKKLRTEILEKGESRDVQESIQAFFGRDFSLESFYKELGINP